MLWYLKGILLEHRALLYDAKRKTKVLKGLQLTYIMQRGDCHCISISRPPHIPRDLKMAANFKSNSSSLTATGVCKLRFCCNVPI